MDVLIVAELRNCERMQARGPELNGKRQFSAFIICTGSLSNERRPLRKCKKFVVVGRLICSLVTISCYCNNKSASVERWDVLTLPLSSKGEVCKNEKQGHSSLASNKSESSHSSLNETWLKKIACRPLKCDMRVCIYMYVIMTLQYRIW